MTVFSDLHEQCKLYNRKSSSTKQAFIPLAFSAGEVCQFDWSQETFDIASAPLFLRKLVLGIPAQASGKNHVAINAFGAPIRPAFVSLRHIIASSMLTP